jgi:undecaprenyl-diphosphatase
MKSGRTVAFDEKCYTMITSRMSETKTFILKGITNMADTYWLIGTSLLVLLLIKSKKTGMSVFVNLALAFLTNHTLKYIIQRPRPTVLRLVEEGGFSFPSGHSMVSMAFYGFLIYLISKKMKNKYAKVSLITLLCVLIFVVGVSRVYLGVHFATDIIAGHLLGVAYLILFINFWVHGFKLPDLTPNHKLSE